ncbi:MAG: hypothetical protein ACRDRJ_44345 [Streptosporangiaceae bacterium]
MGFAKLARQLPARAAAGGFILNSGLSKWHGDEESATQMHAMAASTYPFLAKVPAKDFGRLHLKTEGMRQPGSVRPTPQGVPLAKDIWRASA